ncbi:hypothetical protein ANTRET_LOCUS298 [Anthophora retusa]
MSSPVTGAISVSPTGVLRTIRIPSLSQYPVKGAKFSVATFVELPKAFPNLCKYKRKLSQSDSLARFPLPRSRRKIGETQGKVSILQTDSSVNCLTVHLKRNNLENCN